MFVDLAEDQLSCTWELYGMQNRLSPQPSQKTAKNYDTAEKDVGYSQRIKTTLTFSIVHKSLERDAPTTLNFSIFGSKEGETYDEGTA